MPPGPTRVTTRLPVRGVCDHGEFGVPADEPAQRCGQVAAHDDRWCHASQRAACLGVSVGTGEHERLDLAKRCARLHAQLLDQEASRRAEGRQRIGLPARAVQRRHEQRPQALAERVLRGELRQQADGVARVRVDPKRQAAFGRVQPALDEPVNHRRQTGHIQPSQRRSGPLAQRRVHVAGVQVPAKAADIDRVGGHGEAVGGADPFDRIRAQPLAQLGDVPLHGLLGCPGRLFTPHLLDKSWHRDRRTGRQRKGGEHRLAPGRTDVERLAAVRGGAHAPEQTDLHHWLLRDRLGARRS